MKKRNELILISFLSIRDSRSMDSDCEMKGHWKLGNSNVRLTIFRDVQLHSKRFQAKQKKKTLYSREFRSFSQGRKGKPMNSQVYWCHLPESNRSHQDPEVLLNYIASRSVFSLLRFRLTWNVQRYSSANKRLIFHENVSSERKSFVLKVFFWEKFRLFLPVWSINRKSFSTIAKADEYSRIW